MEKIKIGDLKIENPLILAPMAGVSDYPYRQIIREMGCKLVYSEMVSSKGLVYGSKKTHELINFKRNSGYIAVQIFGKETEYMKRAARMVEKEYHPDIIDINMGCPAPKVVKNGSGAALMKNPKLAGKIIEAVVKAVDIPVTVKIRKGWGESQVDALEIGRIAEDRGASAVAIHGRNRSEFYSGRADWNIIKDLKEELDIPLIGNGDIFTPEDAYNMFEKTGCDAVMLARGVQGNPWLIKRAQHYLKTGELIDEPDCQEKIKMLLYHLNKAVDYYGEKRAIPLMRRHISWYVKGMSHSTDLKNKINSIKKYEEVKTVLKTYRDKIT